MNWKKVKKAKETFEGFMRMHDLRYTLRLTIDELGSGFIGIRFGNGQHWATKTTWFIQQAVALDNLDEGYIMSYKRAIAAF